MCEWYQNTTFEGSHTCIVYIEFDDGVGNLEEKPLMRSSDNIKTHNLKKDTIVLIDGKTPHRVTTPIKSGRRNKFTIHYYD